MRAAGALLDVHSLHRRVVGRRQRRLHLHRLEHEQRPPRVDAVAGATWTRITVPGIGAVMRLSPPPTAWSCAALLSTSGAAEGGAVERIERQPPRQRRRGGAAAAPRAAGARSGRRSSPRPRTTGWATSQRRKGRFVVTPDTSVSASASASRDSASSASGRVRSAWRSSGRRTCPPRRRPRHPRRRERRSAAAAARASRPGARTCAGPRRRAAPRPRAGPRRSDAQPFPGGDRELLADESIPVTSSVTGCSTWIRPFSSNRSRGRRA